MPFPAIDEPTKAFPAIDEAPTGEEREAQTKAELAEAFTGAAETVKEFGGEAWKEMSGFFTNMYQAGKVAAIDMAPNMVHMVSGPAGGSFPILGPPRGPTDRIQLFEDIRKEAGVYTALKGWGFALRDMIGLPVSEKEEKYLQEDLQAYFTLQDKDPLNLREEFNKMMNPAGFKSEEWSKALKGVNNIQSIFVGAGAGRLATSATQRMLNPIWDRLIQAEAHSIASFVVWEAGTAAIEGEDVGEAAARGAVLGAATAPFGLYVLDPILSAGFKATGKGISLAAKPVGAVAKFADKNLERMTYYKYLKDFLKLTWDRIGMSGEAMLNAAGAPQTTTQLIESRGRWHLQSAVWYQRSLEALWGLSPDQRRLVGKLSFPETRGMAIHEANRLGIPLAPLEEAATRLQAPILEVGQMGQAAGIAQQDAGTGAFRRFYMKAEYGMPRLYKDTSKFLTEGPVRDDALKVLQKTHKMTLEEADDFLLTFHKRNVGELVDDVGYSAGTSELHGRQMNLPGFETDPLAVLPDYFSSMARKIEYTKQFGNPATEFTAKTPRGRVREQFPKAFEELDRMPDSSRKTVAEDILYRQLGQYDAIGPWTQRLTQLAQYNAVTKLGTAQIAQVSQFGAALAPSGFRNSLQDMVTLMARNPEIHRRMIGTGAFLETIMRNSHEALMGASHDKLAVQQALKAMGFTTLDTGARQFGVLRGWSMANYAAERAQKISAYMARKPNLNRVERKILERELKGITRKFERLGLDSNKIMENGGFLTSEEMMMAGQKLSTDLNFWADALSLPEFWKHPWGRVAAQFKSFAFQQSKFFKDQIVLPAFRDGDYGPLARWMAISQLSGEMIADLKWMVTGKGERTTEKVKFLGSRIKDKTLRRILENYAYSGGLAIVLDVVRATDWGRPGIWGYLAGPTAQEGVESIEAAGKLLEGKPKKALVNTVELIVPIASRGVLAPATPYLIREMKKKFKEQGIK